MLTLGFVIMMRLKFIWLVLLLPVAMHVNGQDGGGVVVHSDPRLSLLLKKPHNVEPGSSSGSSKHKTSKKEVADMSAPMADARSTKPAKVASYSPGTSPGAAEKSNKPVKVVSYSTGPAASKVTVKEASEDASTTGHAGGWTPPVHRKARSVSTGKGFRVQIYNGPDRNKAIEIKTEFMRSYPGIRTYLSYVAPCFRVKVGDYKNRNEALGMLKEANSMYSSPCMIVPDMVTISTF